MGWFSRPSATRDAPPTAPPPPAKETLPAPAQGRYGPRVKITGFETAPDELTWQLPVRGELYRLMPGPDRPDYSLMVLERPLLFYPPEGLDLEHVGVERLVEDRQGRRMVEVHALVLAALFVGQQLHPGMVDLPVHVAYVMDQSLAQDTSVDLAKIAYAAVGHLTEESGDASTAEPSAVSAAQPDPAAVVESVGREVAVLLREGIAEQRGTAVDRLTATVTIDSANRISGLTGNADGTAPEPTPETFERINAALTRLSDLPPDRTVTTLSIRATVDELAVESSG